MPYKNIEERRKKYQENKDEINRKRREYRKKPEVRERILKEQSEWRSKNRKKANMLSNISKKKYEARVKKEVFEHYGTKCACCGETEQMFLTIDHINGGGRKHRKRIGKKTYTWLYQNNLPKGFQTLCFNCNWGKHVNGGVCPHKSKKN